MVGRRREPKAQQARLASDERQQTLCGCVRTPSRQCSLRGRRLCSIGFAATEERESRGPAGPAKEAGLAHCVSGDI